MPAPRFTSDLGFRSTAYKLELNLSTVEKPSFSDMEGRGTAVRELQHVATPQSVATHMLHRPFWCPGARRLSFLATAPAAAEADAGAQREADGADDDDIPHDEVEAMFTSREVELVHQASSARVRARLTPLMEDVGAAGEGDSADGGDADSSLGEFGRRAARAAGLNPAHAPVRLASRYRQLCVACCLSLTSRTGTRGSW